MVSAMLQWGQPAVLAGKAAWPVIIVVGGIARANLIGFWQKGQFINCYWPMSMGVAVI